MDRYLSREEMSPAEILNCDCDKLLSSASAAARLLAHMSVPLHVTGELFDEVYWDGVEKVLTSCPEMFSVWATKQVSGFFGNNHLMNHIDGHTVDTCPNCGCHPERPQHIIFCRDPAVFNSSVDRFVEWLASQRALTHLSPSFSPSIFADEATF
eukprot:scaffold10339_cov41-Cyclotella_meneghiniana.AAC.7